MLRDVQAPFVAAQTPLRVAVLCSGRAPGLLHLLGAGEHERRWQVVCCLTSEEHFEEETAVAGAGVPILRHPMRAFYRERDARAPLRDLRLREAYDERTADWLSRHRPDLVILAGYLRLLTPPMLNAFRHRIVNVHHSDLRLRSASGGPRYPGLRAVRDAILAGETETRSTAHLVTEHLDDGPTLLRSKVYPVPPVVRWARDNGAEDVLRKAIWAHQEWMLRDAFGPLMVQAINLAMPAPVVGSSANEVEWSMWTCGPAENRACSPLELQTGTTNHPTP